MLALAPGPQGGEQQFNSQNQRRPGGGAKGLELPPGACGEKGLAAGGAGANGFVPVVGGAGEATVPGCGAAGGRLGFAGRRFGSVGLGVAAARSPT